MADPEKNSLTNPETVDIIGSRLEEIASEMDWGELGTAQTPIKLRCIVENGRIVKALLEWPPGKIESFKA